MTPISTTSATSSSAAATPSATGPVRSLVFHKLDGAGNDFIGLDNRDGSLPEGPVRDALIRALCDRHNGVGTDGAVVLEWPSDRSAADVRMRYHNRDGGEAEMCGNGARCLAAFAHHVGAAPALGMRIQTVAGIQRADVLADGTVRLLMPDVAPIRNVGRIDIQGLSAGTWTGEADFLRVGVPHAVVWVDDLEALAVDELGRALRFHAAFAPAGANINFACLAGGNAKDLQDKKDARDSSQSGSGSAAGLESPSAAASVVPASRVFVRTYERGVECETLACGTGSTAVAISAVLAGRAKRPVAVHVRGGDDLLIDFTPTAERGARNVSLTGPARLLFRAETRWNFQSGALIPI